MDNNYVNFKIIGTIHSPYESIEKMPIQPRGASGVRGTLILNPDYLEGLKDLEGFSHIYIIYQFHKTKEQQLTVTPFMDSTPHGVFATRAPKRPNPIGLSVVKLISIEGNVLNLENIDILDGTPVIDIKPYVPAFDQHKNIRVGWLTGTEEEVKSKRSDERFT